MKLVCDFNRTGGGPIGNRFSNLSFWHYVGTTPDERVWHEWAESMPAGWLKNTYPWLEEMQIYVASGGAFLGYPRQVGDMDMCEFDRDLFKNPADRSVLDDYEFNPLVRACRNMLRQGVRPCLKLHAVPIKLTRHPKIGWFRVNCRPPDDYTVYANYISALAQAMVDAFGKDEVCRWRWFVGTEMENPMWWQAADGTPETTQREYCKFHDWTVFALERVLGTECGPIGAHAMMAGDYTGGLWNPEEFFKHCRSGKNAATGGTGSRLDFFALSYYDRAPGFLRADEWQTNLTGDGGDLALFDQLVLRTRSALARQGLAAMPLEVSEGGMLFGMDGKWLWHGLCPGGMFDATWTAWVFWKMMQNHIALWSRWPLLRTGGLFHGLESAATHALRMIDALREDIYCPVTPTDDQRLVRVMAGKAVSGASMRILMFHHAPDVTRPSDPARMALDLVNIPFEGPVRIRRRTLDATQGDFWPQWQKDRAMMGLQDKDYFRSRDQLDVAHALINPTHRVVWEYHEQMYEPLAAYPPAEVYTDHVRQGVLHVSCELPCFSIILYELERIA